MNEEHEKALERLMDRELKKLPDLPAPGSLVHRVMLAVHQRESLPWYKRAWPTWPAGAQFGSILVLTAICGLLIAVMSDPSWLPGWQAAEDSLAVWTAPLFKLAAQIGALFNGFIVVAEAMVKPLLLAGVACVILGCLFSVVLLTACYRLVTKKV